MQVIGLTGGLGSGKTTVCAMFAALGVPIIDADIIAHEITAPHQPAVTAIIQHFGDTVLSSPDLLDRKKIRDIIFKNPNERRWLENLLHPLIIARIKDKISALSAPYCIVAIPLLFETGPYDFIDRILVIDADETMQLARVKLRDGMTDTQITEMLNTQISRDERIKLADDIIYNHGNLADLNIAVEQLHLDYLKKSC